MAGPPQCITRLTIPARVGSLNSTGKRMLPCPRCGKPGAFGFPGSRFEAVSSGGNSTSEFRNSSTAVLADLGQRREGVARLLRLAAVPQDHFAQVDAAAVVAVRRRRADAPQRLRHELRRERAVVVALVKRRPEVVPLQVREEVAHDERAAQRPLDRRMPRAVVLFGDEQRGRREQAVEDPATGSYVVSTSATRRSRSIVRFCTWQPVHPICAQQVAGPICAVADVCDTCPGLK